ncbi:tetratricopeptide repeat protein [Halobacillus sp. H74]|uniref:tetratricopeptide repeat protein n=1 Tax=Halobacillus sp. H74 TaxID=3457436 RepID=UPI003FCE9607
MEQARQFRKEGKMSAARNRFIELTKTFPNDALLHFECGQTHDAMGDEEEAVGYYQKAMELGLPDEYLKDAYVCLGSTYQVLGEYELSLGVFEMGEQQFQQYAPIQVFKSLTLFHQDHPEQAYSVLLDLLIECLEDKDLHKYKRALTHYAKELK